MGWPRHILALPVDVLAGYVGYAATAVAGLSCGQMKVSTVLYYFAPFVGVWAAWSSHKHICSY